MSRPWCYRVTLVPPSLEADLGSVEFVPASVVQEHEAALLRLPPSDMVVEGQELQAQKVEGVVGAQRPFLG